MNSLHPSVNRKRTWKCPHLLAAVRVYGNFLAHGIAARSAARPAEPVYFNDSPDDVGESYPLQGGGGFASGDCNKPSRIGA